MRNTGLSQLLTCMGQETLILVKDRVSRPLLEMGLVSQDINLFIVIATHQLGVSPVKNPNQCQLQSLTHVDPRSSLTKKRRNTGQLVNASDVVKQDT